MRRCGTNFQVTSTAIFNSLTGLSVGEHVYIGKGCWIGGNCSVLAGSVLPEGAILGAGSVADKMYDIPRSLYAGTPARLVKQL